MEAKKQGGCKIKEAPVSEDGDDGSPFFALCIQPRAK